MKAINTKSLLKIIFFQLRDSILENINQMNQKTFCQKDLESLKQWKWNVNITTDQAFSLTNQVNSNESNLSIDFNLIFIFQGIQ